MDVVSDAPQVLSEFVCSIAQKDDDTGILYPALGTTRRTQVLGTLNFLHTFLLLLFDKRIHVMQ